MFAAFLFCLGAQAMSAATILATTSLTCSETTFGFSLSCRADHTASVTATISVVAWISSLRIRNRWIGGPGIRIARV